MKLNRRHFLSLVGIHYLAYREMAQGVGWTGEQRLSILQGLTDETSAEFSLVLPNNTEVELVAINPNTEEIHRPDETKEYRWPGKVGRVVKFLMGGLRLGVEYHLHVIEKNSKTLLDQRKFGLLDLNSSKLRLGVASCMDDHIHRPSIWNSFERNRPDMILLVGDNVYCDQLSRFGKTRTADGEQFWTRYMKARNTIQLYKWKRLVPTLSTWDDHDYGGDGLDRHFKFKNEAKWTHETFFAQKAHFANVDRGPGLSIAFKGFHQQIILLDNRFFRDPSDVPHPQCFGKSQEDWLFSHLTQSSMPTWLVAGNQWFAGSQRVKDSFNIGFPEAHRKFMTRIKESAMGPCAFISGDVHFSEVNRIERDILGYETYEVTSSSIHSLTIPGWHHMVRNSRRINATSSHNYNIINVQSDGVSLKGQVSCYHSRGQLEYEVPIKVELTSDGGDGQKAFNA